MFVGVSISKVVTDHLTTLLGLDRVDRSSTLKITHTHQVAGDSLFNSIEPP